MIGKVILLALLSLWSVNADYNSTIRINFAEDSEAALNRQINQELNTSYIYNSMHDYFSREDIALAGFAKLFRKLGKNCWETAEMMQKYLILRGGDVILGTIKKPDNVNWGFGLDAMNVALQIEKTSHEALLEVWRIASKSGDPQLCGWLTGHLLNDQSELIRKLAGYVTNLKRVGPGQGEFIFDQYLSHHGHQHHHDAKK